jgi:hypothetical protein
MDICVSFFKTYVSEFIDEIPYSGDHHVEDGMNKSINILTVINMDS